MGELDDIPDPIYRYKRPNYLRYVTSGRCLLEIGFNAGHSALLALTANQYLTYTGIDICKYKYTRASFDYLTIWNRSNEKRDARGKISLESPANKLILLPNSDFHFT
jgi:hypothetical protein